MIQGMRLGNDIWLALIFPPAELEPQSIHLVYGTAPLLLHVYLSTSAMPLLLACRHSCGLDCRCGCRYRCVGAVGGGVKLGGGVAVGVLLGCGCGEGVHVIVAVGLSDGGDVRVGVGVGGQV